MVSPSVLSERDLAKWICSTYFCRILFLRSCVQKEGQLEELVNSSSTTLYDLMKKEQECSENKLITVYVLDGVVLLGLGQKWPCQAGYIAWFRQRASDKAFNLLEEEEEEEEERRKA